MKVLVLSAVIGLMTIVTSCTPAESNSIRIASDSIYAAQGVARVLADQYQMPIVLTEQNENNRAQGSFNDIVVSQGVSSPNDTQWADLTQLLDQLDSSAGYLLSPVPEGSAQRSIPLSYDIPLIVWNGNQNQKPQSSELTYLLNQLAFQNWVVEDGALVSFGFFPFESPSFLEALLWSAGADFQLSTDLQWNSEAIVDAETQLRQWWIELLSRDERYEQVDRLLSIPSIARIRAGLQSYGVIRLSDFAQLSPESQAGLRVSPLRHRGEIPIISGGLSMRISANRLNLVAEFEGILERSFHRWVEEQQNEGKNVLRVLKGIPSHRYTSFVLLPQLSPWFGQLGIAEHELSDPSTLPKSWSEVLDQIIGVSFYRNRNKAENSLATIESGIKRWFNFLNVQEP